MGTEYKLSPEQEARLPEFRDKWIKIGTCCDPADRKTAEEGAVEAYHAAGLPSPKAFVWARSIWEGLLYANAVKCGVFTLEGRHVEVTKQLGSESCYFSSHDPSELRNSLEAYFQQNGGVEFIYPIYGQHGVWWLSYIDFFDQVVPEYRPITEPARGLIKVAQSAGWWWPFDDICIMSERTEEVHLDEDGEAHNEEGPAIRYRDGFALWSVHGVEVPQHVIESPETISVEEIRSESNAEVKRIMREKFGTGRFLVETGAKVIDFDERFTQPSKKAGSIYRAVMEDDQGNRYLVASDGSTSRVYEMRVPNDCNTCRAAHEALGQGVPGGLSEDKLLAEG